MTDAQHRAGLEGRQGDALARIVGNLLDNAEKYTREAEDRTIHLAAKRAGEWIALAEQRGQVHRVTAEVDPVEELSAITYIRTRDENAPATNS